MIKAAGILSTKICTRNSVAGLKYFAPPVRYTDVENVERPKLKVMERSPQLPPNIRPPKMQKRLSLMRGPEIVHNALLHKQYAIMAKGGGRLNWGHFEMLRLTIGRKMDISRMFAIWRVPAPWQPITKKGQGQRMGGGKGAIDHYVTPIKKGRIILEVAGKCEFQEVEPFLKQVCNQLPFKAQVVSQNMLDNDTQTPALLERINMNPFTLKYVMQNNLSSCYNWMSPSDHKWFGDYA